MSFTGCSCISFSCYEERSQVTSGGKPSLEVKSCPFFVAFSMIILLVWLTVSTGLQGNLGFLDSRRRLFDPVAPLKSGSLRHKPFAPYLHTTAYTSISVDEGDHEAIKSAKMRTSILQATIPNPHDSLEMMREGSRYETLQHGKPVLETEDSPSISFLAGSSRSKEDVNANDCAEEFHANIDRTLKFGLVGFAVTWLMTGVFKALRNISRDDAVAVESEMPVQPSTPVSIADRESRQSTLAFAAAPRVCNCVIMSAAHVDKNIFVDASRSSTVSDTLAKPHHEENQMDRGQQIHRIWAMSDIHTDCVENFNFVAKLDDLAHRQDVLLIAGDISDNLDVLRNTLRVLRSKFLSVFFVAGNHDLWVSRKQPGIDSLQKLQLLDDLCKEESIETRPRCFQVSSQISVWIVPLMSWHCQGFDSEPSIDARWEGIPSANRICSDYLLCKWPDGLNNFDDSVAVRLDVMNDERIEECGLEEQKKLRSLYAGTREAGDIVISFSHFLPRIELLPEKRYLRRPTLTKIVGSPCLGNRLDRLKPDIHVFGHTHFGWDQDIDGVRYLSPPMGMPRERIQRLSTVAIGNFPRATLCEDEVAEPLLIWDSVQGFPQKYQAAWSAFYEEYSRDPGQVAILPEYVATRYRWNEVKHGPKAAFVGLQDKKPAWSFGPAWTENRKPYC